MLFDFVIFFFLPILIGYILLAMFTDTQYRDDGNLPAAIFHGVFVSLFVGGIMFSGYIVHKRSKMKTEERPYLSYDLVSLDGNEDLNGHSSNIFFVGSGYIGEDLYYHFFYKTSKGIKYDKIDARSIYIMETNEKPKYVKYGDFYVDTKNPYYESGWINKTRQVLFIPKGTIKRDFKINTTNTKNDTPTL